MFTLENVRILKKKQYWLFFNNKKNIRLAIKIYLYLILIENKLNYVYFFNKLS